MDLNELIREVDKLAPEDLDRLKAHLVERENKVRDPGEEWLTKLDSALDEFWKGVSPEEQAAILEAIQIKSLPSEKGL